MSGMGAGCITPREMQFGTDPAGRLNLASLFPFTKGHPGIFSTSLHQESPGSRRGLPTGVGDPTVVTPKVADVHVPVSGT